MKAKVKHFGCEREAYEYEALLVASMKDQLVNEIPAGYGGRAGPAKNSPETAALANVRVLALAIMAKARLCRHPDGMWRQALYRAFAGRADVFIDQLLPIVDKSLLKKELLSRGVQLITADLN